VISSTPGATITMATKSVVTTAARFGLIRRATAACMP
jgi:hypothetical protein